MKAIAIVGKNWELGKGAECAFHIMADRRWFKRMTMGKTVIMGRVTYESIMAKAKDGICLPGRKPIVLSRTMDRVDGVTVCRSMEELKEAAPDDSWVIGGEQVFEELLPQCTHIYLTEVNATSEEAARFFPLVDQSPYWQLVDEGPWEVEGFLKYRFVVYRRKDCDY